MKINMWMDPLCTLEGWFHKLGAPKDLKESNPLEVAEYAITNNLTHEPVFFMVGQIHTQAKGQDNINNKDKDINAIGKNIEFKFRRLFNVHWKLTKGKWN